MTETELKHLLQPSPRRTKPPAPQPTPTGLRWPSPWAGWVALETMLEDAAALTGRPASWIFPAAPCWVLCADNGVVAQGVQPDRCQRDPRRAQNLAARRTSVCQYGQLRPTAMYVPGGYGHRGCTRARRAGTAALPPALLTLPNGPAMTRAQAVEAIGRGHRAGARQKQQRRYSCWRLGDGHWQTTTSSAVASRAAGHHRCRR